MGWGKITHFIDSLLYSHDDLPVLVSAVHICLFPISLHTLPHLSSGLPLPHLPSSSASSPSTILICLFPFYHLSCLIPFYHPLLLLPILPPSPASSPSITLSFLFPFSPLSSALLLAPRSGSVDRDCGTGDPPLVLHSENCRSRSTLPPGSPVPPPSFSLAQFLGYRG